MIHLNKAQKKIKEFTSTIRYYQRELDKLEESDKRKKAQRTAVVQLGPFIGVPKTTIKEVQTIFKGFKTTSSPKEYSALDLLESSFQRDFRNLEDFLVKCVILEGEDSVSTRKPKTYISKVRSVTTLKYKVKHTLDGLQDLNLLGNKLTLREEVITTKKKEVQTVIQKEPIIEEIVISYWKNIDDNEISFAFSIDECEYFERKSEMITAKKTEELLVAMTNTHGGIIVFGITDEKESSPLSSGHRDNIQNQLANISRNNIKPKISPDFKAIIQKDDDGYIFVYVPKNNKLLHTTIKDRYYKRVGSNNVLMTPNEVRDFYKRQQ
ncbi:hypothetical protein ES708_19298 [subsurface metagenome]